MSERTSNDDFADVDGEELKSQQKRADELASMKPDDPKTGEDLRADKAVDPEAVMADAAAHPSTDPGDTNGSPSSPSFMIGMLKWHPFMAYFLFHADCNFPRGMPHHERVKGTRVLHPVLHWCCMVCDFVLMLAMIVFLSLIVVRVAINAFA